MVLTQNLTQKELKRIFYPEKIVYSNDSGFFEINRLLSSEGSESDIYLLKSLTPFFNFSTDKIVMPNNAFVMKVCRTKRGASSNIGELKENLSNFKKKLLEEGFRYEDEETWDVQSSQAFNNMLLSQSLSSGFPDLFPQYMGRLEYVVRDETKWCEHAKYSKGINPNRYYAYRRSKETIYVYNSFITVEEYVGPTLERFLKEKEVNESIKLGIIDKLYQAVCALQQRSSIHKDINLSNILIGINNSPKVIDFSTVQYLAERKYVFGKDDIESFIHPASDYPFDPLQLFIGSRLFRPPETYKGYLSIKNDTWSVGLIAFSILTGEHLIPIVTDNYRIIEATNVSKEEKRMFVESMYKQVTESPERLEKIIQERIMEEERIPNTYKEAISFSLGIHPEKRNSIDQILSCIKVSKPTKKKFTQHNHDEIRISMFGEEYCGICTFAYLDSMTKKEKREIEKSMGGIPKELIWRGMSIDDALRLETEYR